MYKISLLLILAASLGACKKDSENSPNKAELLTAKSWRISAQSSSYSSPSINNGAAITTDEYAAMASCERDNLFKFSANQTLVFDEGATKCDSSDPQTQNGTWYFNSDQTRLTLSDPSQGIPTSSFDIIAISASKLQLRYTYSYSSGGISATQTENVTFTAF